MQADMTPQDDQIYPGVLRYVSEWNSCQVFPRSEMGDFHRESKASEGE